MGIYSGETEYSYGRRMDLIQVFKYMTSFLDKGEQKNWKRFACLGCIRAIIDVFSFYVTVYFISTISEDTVLAGGLRAAVILLMFLSEVVLEMFRCRFSNHFLYYGTQQLSMKVFELFAKEDLEQHEQKSVMQALEIVRSDTMKSMNIILACVGLGVNIFTMAGYAVILTYISKWFGIIASLVFAVLIAAVFLMYRAQMKMYGEKCRKYEIRANAQITLEYGIFEEMKISGHTAPVLEKYHDASMAFTQAQSKYNYRNEIIAVFMNLWAKAIMLIIFVSLFLWGAELSNFIPVTVYVSALSRMATLSYSIVGGLNSIEFSRKPYKELKECLDRYVELKKEEERLAGIRQKNVTFKKGMYIRNLTFRYDGRENLFEDVSLEIPAGASVAVIGTSGAGKTTFLSLILGLLKPQSGAVFYDDYDIVSQSDTEGACQAKIGDIVSYIPQVVYMNGETICNNVALLAKQTEIDDERIIECLKYAQIWEDIAKMPEGIHTVIGENGTAISGGQRQRIALARALYKNFELLIMDEATAALDMETEKAVMDAIGQVRKERTLLIVTHHMSLANECDIVYKIQDRKLVRVR